MSDEVLPTTIADTGGIRERLNRSLAGRYRVDGGLGEGGMATVWLAEDLKHRRRVAIKVLRPEVADSIGSDRFMQEIEIAAGLRHPRILPLFDSGHADGLLYYVMPHIEGESLRARMERGPALGTDDAVRIVTEVAEALSYAHGRDVVHRDIKPENILLEDGHALVADFGVARAVMNADDTRLTSAGMRVGTPLYMSPEQAQGRTDVDARGDLYSLGCMLFELIAGRPAFTGATAEAILIQRFTQPPPRLSSVKGGVSSAIDNAVFRAMARDPADRFDSVARFVEALRSGSSRAAGTAASSIAVLPFTNMGGSSDDEYFSDGISEEIINALTRVDGLRVAARTSTFAFKGKHEDLRSVGERLNVTTVLEGSVRKAGNRLRITAQLINVADGYHLWSERYDRELTDVFEIQDEIAAAIATKLRGTLAAETPQRHGTSNLEAYDLFLRGRALQWKRGRFVLDSTALLEKAVDLDPKFVDAHAVLADGYRLLALYGARRPAEAMPKARAAAERALALDPNQAEALTTLADVAHTYELDYELGLTLWNRALKAQPDYVRTLGDHALWGLALLENKPEEALAQMRRAMEIDPLSSWVAGIHALVLLMLGRIAESQAEGRRSMELDPTSFLAHWTVLSADLAAGEPRRAIESALRSLESWRHPWLLGRLGVAYAMAGDPELAGAVFDELEARSKTDYVQPMWMAVVAAALGRGDEAVDLMMKSIHDRDPINPWLVALPECAPLRRHARYPELLHAMKLDEFWRRRGMQPRA
jgi:serine/threonine-protein kinase